MDNWLTILGTVIGIVGTVFGIYWTLFVYHKDKNLKNEVEKETQYSGLKGLLPDYYFPLHLGQLTERVGLDPEKDKPLEFPIVSWQESTIHPREKVFNRFAENELFEKWIHEPGIYLIIGEPGGGKTTLMDQWRQRSQKYTAVVSDTMWFPFREHSPGELKRKAKINSRNPLFLFDGWDESNSSMKAHFKEILPLLKGVVIISCRSAVYEKEFQGKLKTGDPLYLMGVDKLEQRSFLTELAQKWAQSKNPELTAFTRADGQWALELWNIIHSQLHINRISGSPLLLTLLAFMHPPSKQNVLKIPETRLEFYQKAFEWLCQNKFDLKESPDFINNAACYLREIVKTSQLKPVIPYYVFVDSYNKVKAKFPDCEPLKELLKSITKTGIINYKPLSNTYEFLHLTFQEWLYSEALSREQELLNLVEQHWLNPRYDEVLSLMWGLNTIDPEEKILATEYLIEQGCVNITMDKLASRSGLQAALSLWASSGIDLEGFQYAALLKQLTTLIMKSTFTKIKASTLLLPLPFYSQLAADEDERVRVSVARNSNTPAQVFMKLAVDKDEGVRWSVAMNPSAPAEVLQQLAVDKNYWVRMRVAENPNSTVQVFMLLAVDKDEGVRVSLAQNPNVQTEVLQQLAADVSESVGWRVAANPNAPAGLLQKWAEHVDESYRLSVAMNPNASAGLLHKLAADENPAVRMWLTRNPNVPVGVVTKLEADDDERVRKSVAWSPNAPEELLQQLVEDDNYSTRKIVAWNPSSPAELLRQLATDENSWVRRDVAMNPNTPAEALQQLATDEDLAVRLRVAWNTNTPTEMLMHLAADKDVEVRAGVAWTPNASAELLQHLAADEDEHVRKCVAWNLNSCIEWF